MRAACFVRPCVCACFFVVLSFLQESGVLGFGGTTDDSLSHAQSNFHWERMVHTGYRCKPSWLLCVFHHQFSCGFHVFWALRGGVVGPSNSSYTQAVSRTKILADRILCPGATVREHRPRRALGALYILVNCAWWGYRVRPTQYV